MNCRTCFSKKSQFSDIIQRHIQLTYPNHTYSFIKTNGHISFKMIFLCILVVVDRLLLLCVYEFNVIIYMQCDCFHLYTQTAAHNSYKIVYINWMC